MKIYRAVVEDNNDPEKIGRVKVRIFGIHTKNIGGTFTSILISDLPWADVIGGTGFGLLSGVGLSSILRKGTWVWVILDEDNQNKPIVIGVLIGKNDGKNTGGFNDPDGIYPKSGRETRTDIHPLLDNKYQTLTTLETPSGHLIELDDTVGDERIKVTHKNGASILIDSNSNMFVSGINNADYSIGSNVTWNVGGKFTINTGDKFAINTGDKFTIDASANVDITAANINLN